MSMAICWRLMDEDANNSGSWQYQLNIPLPCMHHIFSIGIGSGIWYLDSVVMDGIDTSRQLPRKCVCPSNIERFRRAGRYIRLSVEHVLPHSSTWQNIGGRCSA
jgi:hypothetical protein